MSKNGNLSVDMLGGNLYKNIINFAVPVALTSVLQLLYNAADMAVIGRFGGTNSLGAVGTSFPLANVIINLFMGLSVGVGVVVTHGLGAKDNDRVKRAVHTAFPVAFWGGVFMAVLGWLVVYPTLRYMNTPEDILEPAVLYLKIYFLGIPGSLIYNNGASILRADGDSKTPLLYLSISGAINVVLNLFFVIVFHMDVAGVALATSLTNYLSAFLVVKALSKKNDACRFDIKEVKIYKDSLIDMLKIGIPAGIQTSIFSLADVFIQKYINIFDTAAIAGGSAAGNVGGFMHAILNGVIMAASNFAGQNFGAKQYDRIYKIKNATLVLNVTIGAALGVLAYVFGPQILSIFIKDDPAAVHYGMVRILYSSTPIFIITSINIYAGILRSIEYSTLTMVISLGGHCGIRILLLLLLFDKYPTLEFVYLTAPIAWTGTLIAMAACFRVLSKRKFEECRQRDAAKAQ